MTTSEFLTHLRSLGIELQLQNSRIICNAPKGVMTPELQTELSDRKAEILSFLSQVEQIVPTQGSDSQGLSSQIPPIMPRTSKENIPASFAQQRLWFLNQLVPNSSIYNISTAYQLVGQLDIDALEWSLGEIIRRHEVLRTNFMAVDGQPVQAIAPAVTLKFSVVDLRGISEQEVSIQQLALQEAAQPFNLEQDLLIRVKLLHLEETKYVLLLTMHHIIFDGWSFNIFFQELSQLYQASLNNAPAPLPELPIQYADFTLWQQHQEDIFNSQLSYWQQQLGGSLPVLQIPLDYPRPPVQTYTGAYQPLKLSLELTNALRSLSQSSGVTLFMTLLAAFQTLLYRYSGQEEIIVGSPIAGRKQVETEKLIGFFVNTLALRTNLTGEPSFQELLQRVREVTLEAYEHQDTPLDKLVEELTERDASRSPLFQAVFAFQNTPNYSWELPGLTITPLKIHNHTAKFELTLNLTDIATGIEGGVEYNTDLFAAETITRLVENFQTLLESIIADPTRSIATLPILSMREQQKLLVEWNNTPTDYPHNVCIHELFATQAQKTPHAVAITLNDQHFTYKELDTKANQLAHRLQKLGVKPDSLVGICISRSLETIVGLLGILKAGGAYVPIDLNQPPDRVAYLLQDTQMPVLLIPPPLREKLPLPEITLVDLELAAFNQEPDTTPISGVNANNIAYIIYTSGSTGKPKGVETPHRGVTRLLFGVDYMDFHAHHKFLQMAPISFDASTWEIWGALLHGSQCVIFTEAVPTAPSLKKAIQEQGITTIWLTAALFNAIVDTEPSALRGIQQLLTGGEALSISHVTRARAALPDTQIINGYGPTESTTFTCCYQIPKTLGKSLTSIPIGTPIGNTQVYILDKYLQPVPLGLAGELHIGGAGLAKGYLHRPDLTAEKFISNPFGTGRLYKTGDLARYLPDGNIEFLGRIDNQVKLRGYRIELGEIEAVLGQHPQVQATAVIVREETPGDKRLVAYIVPKVDDEIDPEIDPETTPKIDSKQPSTLNLGSELRDFLKRQLPEYMVPNFFMLLEALPITANGKLDQRALLAISTINHHSTETFIAPRTPTEEVLAFIWAEVLKLDISLAVGSNDNFFALGGHSLLGMQMLARIRANLGVEIPVQSLFTHPTLRELAQEIDSDRFSIIEHHDPQPILQPVDWEGGLPLSFGQESLWFLDQLNPNSAFYNIPTALRLQGQLDYQVLQQSIQEILRRHAALRTNFTTLQGEIIQVISLHRTLDLPVVDLQNLPAPEQAEETKQLINIEAAKPFNLTQEPLIRSLLLQLGATEQVLVITMHHIVSDGWSMGVFVRELTALYGALATGQPSPLPELTIQYPDFAVWQRQWLQSGVLQSQLAYWQQQLANIPALLELPYDRPRPAKQTYQGAIQSFQLPPDLTRAIVLLSRKQNVTLFMTLLAAFQVLLFRYTQSPDICIGTPTANRNQTEVAGLIGFFVNTLVLRINLIDHPSFEELLGRVREMALEAYAHQDVPLEKVVELLQPQRSLSYSPLFQVMFVLQNTAVTTWKLQGLTIEELPVETNTAKFDLILSLEETDAGLVGNWEYNTDLFDDATITRMAGHFQTLLEGIIADPQEKITHLPLLTEPEQQLLQAWNHTQTAYPRDASIHELFVAQGLQNPEAIALVFAEEQITYQELNHRANQLAHHLQTWGVKPEVTVGLCLERSIDLIVAILGILKAGGVYVPLDPSYPSERLAFMFHNAQAGILLTESKLVTQLPSHQGQVICLDLDRELINNYSQENPPSQTTATDLAYIMYTSGSTGQPKSVGVTHRGVVRLVKGNDYAHLSSSEVFLQLAPIAFDASTLEIWGSLLNGAKLVIAPPHKVSLGELGQIIHNHHITILWLTAGLFHLMVDERLADLKPLRQLLAGGDILSVPQVQRFLQANPDCQLINGYGPTENTTFSCCYRITKAMIGEKSIPIGRPIANTQVYILDPQLQLVPVGVQGELYIGGDGLARGYLNRPDLTAERFIPNPFQEATKDITRLYKTGDAVRYLPDGNIEFLGRLDNQVKIRGFRIELGEVESVLAQHPAIEQTVVIAREYPVGDKYLVAYITPENLGVTIDELRHFLKQKLPDYMMPSAFVTLTALPINAVGKVDRRALPDPNEINQESRETSVAPRDQVESQLLEMWLQILSKKNLSIRDRFFEDLGGNSLAAARLFLRIEEVFNKVLPLAILYEVPTIEGIAKIIRQQEWSPSWSSLVPIQPRGTKIPLFCIHPGGGNVLCYRTLAPYLGTDQPVYGLQARGLDGKEEAIDNVQVMASNYLQEIKTLQSKGPYLLAGYSFGGIVAYEIAQQLQQEGQEVAAVILLDTINPCIVRQGVTSLAEKLRLHAVNLSKLDLSGKLGYFTHRWDLKVKSATSKLKAQFYTLRGQPNSEAIADYLLKLDATNYQAFLRYQTQPYSGKVVLFETIERPTNLYHETSLGWAASTKNGENELEIIDGIPGHHGTMLEEPYVAFLGKKLKIYLEQFNPK